MNRPVITQLSTFLLRYTTALPHHISLISVLLTLLSSYVIHSNSWGTLIIGGLLFQAAILFEASSHDVLTQRSEQRLSHLCCLITPIILPTVFFVSLGFSVYLKTGHILILSLVIVQFWLGGFTSIRLTQLIRRTTNNAASVVNNLYKTNNTTQHRIWTLFVRTPIIQAVLVVILLLGNAPTLLWNISLGFSLLSSIDTLVSLRKQNVNEGALPIQSFAIVIGTITILSLMHYYPMHQLFNAYTNLGWNLVWLFVFMPVLLMINACTLGVLIPQKTSITALFYNQIVGEGYNALLPLGGFGGEPIKFSQLSHVIKKETLSAALVLDRIIQAGSGCLVGCVLALISLYYLEASTTTTLLFLASIITFLGGIFLLWLAFSQNSSKIMSTFLARFVLKTPWTITYISYSRLITALMLKLLARIVSIVEIMVMLHLLDISLTVETIAIIMTMLTFSAIFLFFIPQGLGSNELSVLGAFVLLGIPHPLGLLLALMYRTRTLAWGVFGLFLHVITLPFKPYHRRITAT